MKNLIKKIIFGLIILFLGLFIFITMTWDKKFDAPYPDIEASNDSTIIARGQYLAFGPAHCGTCHVPMDKIMDVENGLVMPLKGGWELSIPPGIFRAPNITPDEETGIGKLTDGEIARIMRHSIKADGTMLFPFMPFQEMTDDDVQAIISFLKSQEAVSNTVEKTELSFLGKMINAFGLMKAESPKTAPLKSIEKDSTIAYGKYIASSVANCMGCHTERDLKTGEFVGEFFAGGMTFPPDEFNKGYIFTTPNLTPDEETGVMTTWTQEDFISRFRGGTIHEGTPMPWGSFSRIDEIELKAIYKFLQALDPVNNKIEKTVYPPGTDMSNI